MDGRQVLEREFSNVASMCLQDGMQKVRGSNPLSSTDLSDLCSILNTLIKTLTGLGFFVALACVVFLVVEDTVHHGRFPADLRHDQVAVDGLGDVGRLVGSGIWPLFREGLGVG
jgi:hypothetical protein